MVKILKFLENSEDKVFSLINKNCDKFIEASNKLSTYIQEYESYDKSEKLQKEGDMLSKELYPLEKKIENTEEFFDQVGIVDDNILELERRVGAPVDLFNPEHLKKLLDGIAQMRLENFQAFRNSLKNEPDFSSPTFFWVLYFNPHGTNDIELNWPAKVGTKHLFPCRLVARQLINQVKHVGIELDSHAESVILKAMPFTSSGHSWRINDKEFSQDIETERKNALEEFYSLPQSSDISKTAADVLKKFRLLDLFRYSDKTLYEGARSGQFDASLLNSKLLNPEIKEIVRKSQETTEHADFFGHGLPYAIQSIGCFIKREWDRSENR